MLIATTIAATATVGRVRAYVTSRLIDVILQFTMHAQKMLLHMIGPIELLEAGEALEGLLLFMYVLVTSVEISPIGGVGTVCAGVTFLHLYTAIVVGIIAILLIIMRVAVVAV